MGSHPETWGYKPGNPDDSRGAASSMRPHRHAESKQGKYPGSTLAVVGNAPNGAVFVFVACVAVFDGVASDGARAHQGTKARRRRSTAQPGK
ncbi:hypothetical protein [Mobiluncus mulieris]|uniref:hypothetical protein n=1 Tax=Mobiluncus mulieris TaxID=2052 RepID=UPI001470703E|nr:hypothetical protein [Mobiluncus mulieris]NMX18835.1 hypothetical protein [Mobiluncus mulieris]